MYFYDIVYDVAKKRGIGVDDLSTRIGRVSSYISSAKSRGSSPHVDIAALILEACGYALCMAPNGSVPEDAYIIDPVTKKQ